MWIAGETNPCYNPHFEFGGTTTTRAWTMILALASFPRSMTMPRVRIWELCIFLLPATKRHRRNLTGRWRSYIPFTSAGRSQGSTQPRRTIHTCGLAYWGIAPSHLCDRLLARLALLVRGSSRRITIMRFRPANIRVINRRRSFSTSHSLCPRNERLRALLNLYCLRRKDSK